jgi:hypothetical protein
MAPKRSSRRSRRSRGRKSRSSRGDYRRVPPPLPRVFSDEQLLALDTRKKKRALKEFEQQLTTMRGNLKMFRESVRKIEAGESFGKDSFGRELSNYSLRQHYLPNERSAIAYLEKEIPRTEEAVRRIERALAR